MTRIKLYCRGAMARAQVEGQLTHAMVGVRAELQWDEAWDGLAKTVKIRCAEVCRTAVVSEDGTAVIPSECLIAGQRLEIGLDGWDADGTLRIPSSWASCGVVKPSVAQCDGPEGAPPTVDTVTQIQILFNKLESLMGSVPSDFSQLLEEIGALRKEVEELKELVEMEEKTGTAILDIAILDMAKLA